MGEIMKKLTGLIVSISLFTFDRSNCGYVLNLLLIDKLYLNGLQYFKTYKDRLM